MPETTTMPAEVVRAGAELRVTVGRIARRLRQTREVGDVTLSESSALARLDRQGPTSPGVLAEEERVRPQAMGTTLAALEKRGLVHRQPDEKDGRRVLMTVTAKGRKVLRDRRFQNSQRIARALQEEFTPAERRRLVAVLPLLDRLAERL
ncbi:MAG TPA: MarR family transcriptional regulator [Amycolatopsis sp.]|nr:MarR family transcriptional regulator [Amycolatopsis sp.]